LRKTTQPNKSVLKGNTITPYSTHCKQR